MTKVTIQANVIRTNDGSNLQLENTATYQNIPSYDDMSAADLLCKDNLQDFIPTIAPEPSTIDIPIGTATPYYIDYAADYSQHGFNPTVWVEIFRQEDSPIITEEIDIPIQRLRLSDAVETLNIMFGDNPTIDHYRVIIK